MQTLLFQEKKDKSLSDWMMVLKILSLMFFMLLVFLIIYWAWEGQLSVRGHNMQIYYLLVKVKMALNRLFPLKIHHEKLSYLSFVIPNDDGLWHHVFFIFPFCFSFFLIYPARKLPELDSKVPPPPRFTTMETLTTHQYNCVVLKLHCWYDFVFWVVIILYSWILEPHPQVEW